MLQDWTTLSDDAQLYLAREALGRAAELIAKQAEYLAEEFDAGGLVDRGGSDALRLFAAIIRMNDSVAEEAAGRA